MAQEHQRTVAQSSRMLLISRICVSGRRMCLLDYCFSVTMLEPLPSQSPLTDGSGWVSLLSCGVDSCGQCVTVLAHGAWCPQPTRIPCSLLLQCWEEKCPVGLSNHVWLL